MNLKDKVAVVTGASDGIGKQIALKLAKEGVNLALVARTEEKLKEVKKEAENMGSPKVEVYSCDLRDKTQIKNSVNKIAVDFKGVDILLNVAGIWQKMDLLEDVDESAISNVIEVDLIGLICMTKFAMKFLKESSEAVIINVSSKSGITAQPGQSVYTAAKWGVAGFTEVLKQDLKGTTVRVAGVYQAGTDTEMFRKTGEHFEQGKFTRPEDLADVVVFMLSRPPKIWLHDVRVEY